MIIWRGWGLLALVMMFPVMASCIAFIDSGPKWICFLTTSVALVIAGVVGIHFGSRWNRQENVHSLYFIPIQIWGWMYLGSVGAFAFLAVIGGIYRAINPMQGRPDPDRLNPAYSFAAGTLGLLVVGAISWALVRSNRKQELEESDQLNKLTEPIYSEPWIQQNQNLQ